MPRRKVDAAAVVFALLVAVTLAAFAYAQRAKRDPLLIDRVEIGPKKSNVFLPEGPCDRRRIKLRFRTTTSNDGTVEVIRPGGEVVRVLAEGTFLKRYSYNVFHWDGRGDDGKVEPAGRYRLRVLLAGEDRSLVLPGTIRLHEPRGAPKLPNGAGVAFACGVRKGRPG